MSTPAAPAPAAGTVAHLAGVSLRYGRRLALEDVSLSIPAGCMAGIIGPDGVGKSSLLSLVAGARAIQSGSVHVLGGDMRSARHRARVAPCIAYMPQGLGRNLYPTLSVFENVDFFGSLFGHDRREREARIADLLEATGLAPFAGRAAGKLSGGMKQKLGLCCALIHDPELLVLDEPTTGVDPLSRRQFWDLIARLRESRPGMSVLVATAYMEEAAGFDWLAAMSGGRVLASGSPAELLAAGGARTLEEAFVALLPPEQRAGHRPLPPRGPHPGGTEIAIRARDLTMRFGDFTAVDHVSFDIRRGEIFGFLGSNGCGKTTTMKMLTGLLPPSGGEAWLFGRPVDHRDIETRRRVGYMTQGFSLYRELSVRQNLELHARLFGMSGKEAAARADGMAERFGLAGVMDALPGTLPPGVRQRLSLAVAMIHDPDMLILDEPTSGVDPVARDEFWNALVDLARRDGVTIFISTHFMNEAERCDRVSLMHAGRVLANDAPAAIRERYGASTLEEAFIRCLEASEADTGAARAVPVPARIGRDMSGPTPWRVRLQRLMSCALRETMELRRDPVRLVMAGLGSVLLMLVVSYGTSMDVEDLAFAVLDRDQTATSRDYVLNLSGSRYFIEQPPLRDYEDLERRMRAAEISLALEIPPGFARDIARGTPTGVGAWIDGAMPMRGETVKGYVQGMHQHWLKYRAREGAGTAAAAFDIEIRYRYNPDVRSLPAMVPAMIPVLLLLIPAMLTALAVVREKELGSIVNLYVTPVSRLEFLLGKQLPYIVLAMANFLLLTLMAVTVFGVPVKGSFATLAAGALLYVIAATAMGQVISTFTRSQAASLFATAILTMIPAAQYCGLLEPVSSLEGAGRFIGEIYPTTHFLTIARGTFAKALGFAELRDAFPPLLAALPVLTVLSALLLRKQER